MKIAMNMKKYRLRHILLSFLILFFLQLPAAVYADDAFAALEAQPQTGTYATNQPFTVNLKIDSRENSLNIVYLVLHADGAAIRDCTADKAYEPIFNQFPCAVSADKKSVTFLMQTTEVNGPHGVVSVANLTLIAPDTGNATLSYLPESTITVKQGAESVLGTVSNSDSVIGKYTIINGTADSNAVPVPPPNQNLPFWQQIIFFFQNLFPRNK
jgi:hypothetical protein